MAHTGSRQFLLDNGLLPDRPPGFAARLSGGPCRQFCGKILRLFKAFQRRFFRTKMNINKPNKSIV